MFKDENVSLTSTVQNIKDISKTFIDFTHSFTVPASDKNNKIFKHWDKAEIIGGFDSRTRKEAVMELSHYPFKKGKIQLNKAQKKNGVVENYQLTFFGDIVQITDKFGEDKLTDLDLSAYAHTFNSDNVYDGLRGGYLKLGEVIYPLISSERVWTWESTTTPLTNINVGGTTPSTKGILWNELKPAIKLQTILNAIQTKYGLTFSDHFFNSTDFLKLWIWASKEKGLMKAYGSNDLITWINDAGTPLTDTQHYTTEESKEKVTVTITPEAGYEEVSYTLTRSVTVNSTPLEVLDPVTLQRVGTGQDIVTKGATESSKTITYHISASESFSYQAEILAFRFGTNPNWEASTGIKSVSGVVNFTDVTTDGIKQLGQLPEIKVVDFFRGIISMFNLVVVPDGDRFIVQSLNDWYVAGQTKDFSKWIDLSEESVNRTNLYKVINFNYQTPETIIQDNFEDTNDRFYGDLEYESDVDGDTFEIQLPFENLVGSLITDSDGTLTNVRTYNAIDKNLDPVKIKPFIFYNTNTNTAPTDDLAFWNDAGTIDTVTSYNDIGQENHPLPELITRSLNWGEEISTFTLSSMANSLFNDYWSTYITDIFDEKRRMFKFSGIIPTGILSNLKLNDKLVINGRRYLINQFTANLLTGKVDFELLNDMLELAAIETNNDGLQYDLQTGITG